MTVQSLFGEATGKDLVLIKAPSAPSVTSEG